MAYASFDSSFFYLKKVLKWIGAILERKWNEKHLREFIALKGWNPYPCSYNTIKIFLSSNLNRVQNPIQLSLFSLNGRLHASVTITHHWHDISFNRQTILIFIIILKLILNCNPVFGQVTLAQHKKKKMLTC